MVAKRRVLLAAALLLLFLPLAAGAAATRDALHGTWGIDVEKTLRVNEKWKAVHDGLGPEERPALRRNWEAKALVVDFSSYTLEELVEGKRSQLCRVAEVHRNGEALRVKVLPPEAPAYLVDMTLQEPDSMLFVIEGQTPVILKRKR